MISVAMATYNGELYIRKQLDSILNQSLHVDEIIICDDGSKDDTVKILQSYQRKYPEIKLYENAENLGYKKNFKKALSLCRGDYIFLCDQDDMWHRDKVQTMLKMMQSHPNILSLASSFTFIDKNGKEIPVDPIPGRSNNNLYLKPVKADDLVEVSLDEYMAHNYFQGCSLVLTKSLKDWFVQNFSDYLPHDWLINLYASYKHGMYFYNHSLFDYRIHENNTIGADMSLTVSNGDFSDKMKLADTEYTRTLVTKCGLNVLESIKHSIPELYDREKYDGLLLFYHRHVDAIENRKLGQLIRLNFNPYYAKTKKVTGRLMDLYFVVKNRRVKK